MCLQHATALGTEAQYKASVVKINRRSIHAVNRPYNMPSSIANEISGAHKSGLPVCII